MASKYEGPKLKGNSYVAWSDVAKSYLEAEGLWDHVIGEHTDKKLEAKSKTAIYSMLDMDIIRQFSNMTSNDALWKALEYCYCKV